MEIKGGLLYAAIIPGILAAAIGIYAISELNSKIELAGTLGASMSIGIGLYLVVLAGIALPIVGFLIKDKKEVSE